jgi:hypothetical protein
MNRLDDAYLNVRWFSDAVSFLAKLRFTLSSISLEVDQDTEKIKPKSHAGFCFQQFPKRS